MGTSQSCAFAVFEDSRVVGPLGPPEPSAPLQPLEFTASTTDPDLVSMSSRSGLSVATISRVQAALRANGSLFITADNLAAYMSMSDRNARRILQRLEEAGLARVAGLNQAGTRGRPQKVYRVTLS
jgi:response regulator of citrate/malate metabolism